jgi:hypothetical protein
LAALPERRGRGMTAILAARDAAGALLRRAPNR